MKENEEEKVEDTPNKQEGILLNGVTKIEIPETTETEESEIEDAFAESIEYEEISEIETSPMNEPVKVGEVSEGIKRIELPKSELNTPNNEATEEEDLPKEMLEDYLEESAPPLDAPEQPIDEEEEQPPEFEENNSRSSSSIDNANDHAKFAADSLIGVADNLLAIGGGFFVKIKKRKSHLYFDELVERNPMEDNMPQIGKSIDDQNAKNLKRIKLDKADIELLRPIVIQVLKQQTKQLTPEQQLIAIGISIVAKKAQMVMEMKAENALFIQNLDNRIEKHLESYEKLVERNEHIINQEQNVKKAKVTEAAK